VSATSIGVDLSTSKQKRGVVSIDWSDTGVRATIHRNERALDSIAALAQAGTIAIDAPFGWPEAFVDFVADPEAFYDRKEGADYSDFSPELRLRVTDHWVKDQTGLNPMSVSMDKIGATAVVCGQLRQKIRSLGGAHDVIEAYPSATARLLEITPRTDDTWQQICDFLNLTKPPKPNSHEVDAALAAITARCHDLGRTLPCEQTIPHGEGQIVLPERDLTVRDLL